MGEEGRKRGKEGNSGSWQKQAESGEQGDKHLLWQAGIQKKSRTAGTEVKGKGKTRPLLYGASPRSNHTASAHARLGGVSALLPHFPPCPPELGQLGGMRISHCSKDFCSPLPGAGMLAASLPAELESPPLLMLLLEHINPYISAGIFFMGAAR